MLPTFALALLGTACGERFELGAVEQNLDQGGDGALSLPLIADGVEDADAPVEDGLPGAVLGMGDVDGDGFDDWIVHDRPLTYGRPRHAEGILRTPEDEGLFFTLGLDADSHSVRAFAERAGDINGDGYGDIVFSTHGYHEHAEERWAQSRAYLWFGSPIRRTGPGLLDEVAVPFPTPADLSSYFESELTLGSSLDEVELEANQAVKLTPLGDIDDDGYDDLAWSASLSKLGLGEQPCAPDASCNGATSQGSAHVTYIVYGGTEPLTSPLTSAARLPGVSELIAIGDVNGDGFADMQSVTGGAAKLLAGSAERFAGELAIDELGVAMADYVPLNRHQIGDIDRDGCDDLLVTWEADGESTRNYLIYGSPGLLEAPLDKSAASAMFAVHGPFSTFLPLGDWNGDGASDLLLYHARIVTDQFSPFAGVEVRLLPGSNQRYSGEHEISVHRPDATIDSGNISAATSPGDVDGDGFADMFIGMNPAYVKYGAPLPPTPIY